MGNRPVLIFGIFVLLFLLTVPDALAQDPHGEANPYGPQHILQAVADLKVATAGQSPPAGTKLALLPSAVTPFWAAAQIGVARASAELNVPVTFVTPTTSQKASQQLSMFESLINDKYTAIAFSALDRDAPKNAIETAVNQGIHVICTDSDATGSARSIYIGMSDYDAGRAAGEASLEVIGKGKIVGLAGYGAAQNTRDRIAGVKDVLEGTELDLVEVLLDDARPDVALANAQSALRKYPDLMGLIAFYSYEGPLAGQVVSQAGKSGEVKIVAFDAGPGTQQLMKEGVIQVIIGQRVYFYGYLSGYVMHAMSVLGEAETLKALAPYLSPWPDRASGAVDVGAEGNIHLNTGFDRIKVDSLDEYDAYLESVGIPSR